MDEDYCDNCGELCDLYGHFYGADVCHECFDELTGTEFDEPE